MQTEAGSQHAALTAALAGEGKCGHCWQICGQPCSSVASGSGAAAELSSAARAQGAVALEQPSKKIKMFILRYTQLQRA